MRTSPTTSSTSTRPSETRAWDTPAMGCPSTPAPTSGTISNAFARLSACIVSENTSTTGVVPALVIPEGKTDWISGGPSTTHAPSIGRAAGLSATGPPGPLQPVVKTQVTLSVQAPPARASASTGAMQRGDGRDKGRELGGTGGPGRRSARPRDVADRSPIPGCSRRCGWGGEKLVALAWMGQGGG